MAKTPFKKNFDAQILKDLRENSRERLITISKKHKKPLLEVMHLYEELRPVIMKHTSLISQEKFRKKYPSYKRYYLYVMCDVGTRNFILLKNFLKGRSEINNLYICNTGIAIDIFSSKKKLKIMLKSISGFEFQTIRYYEILQSMMEERFYGL